MHRMDYIVETSLNHKSMKWQVRPHREMQNFFIYNSMKNFTLLSGGDHIKNIYFSEIHNKLMQIICIYKSQFTLEFWYNIEPI